MSHGHQHGQHQHGPQGHRHGHGHHHAHGAEDIDWAELAPQLERQAELQLPFVRAAANWLRTLAGELRIQRITDVGSGPGVVACALAKAFPEAEVVAVDGTTALLDRARERAVREGVGDRLTVRRAEFPQDLGDLDRTDLLWTSNTLHHIGDQQSALTELAALLTPGGLLALSERGLTPRFLPRDIGLGRPGLQSRLDAANEEWFTRMRLALPDSKPVVEDWSALLAAAGLAPAGTRSFLTDLPAPLGPEARAYLQTLLSRRREQLDEQLDDEDLRTMDTLIDEHSDAGILRRPDAFYLTATTVHTGRRRSEG